MIMGCMCDAVILWGGQEAIARFKRVFFMQRITNPNSEAPDRCEYIGL